MKNAFGFLVLTFAIISTGCGHTAAATASSDPSVAELIEQNRALQARVDELMTGAPATSGGSTSSDGGAYTSGPVLTGSAPTTSPMMSCDGVDSMGMVMSGMLTETMAFGAGGRPWERTGASTGGMRHRVDYDGVFPIALAVNGRVVHEFVGGTPTSVTMRMPDGGYCSMPAIPATASGARTGMSYRSVDFVFDEFSRSQELEVICLSGGSGRASTPFASWTIAIDMATHTGYTRITDDMCREHAHG